MTYFHLEEHYLCFLKFLKDISATMSEATSIFHIFIFWLHYCLMIKMWIMLEKKKQWNFQMKSLLDFEIACYVSSY